MKTWNELLQLPWHKAFIEIGMPKKEVRKLRREMAALVKQQKELKEEIVKKHGSIENFQKIFPDLINQASKLPIREHKNGTTNR